ncbi:hypothetical protein MMJ53_08010 [Enterococcus cecorum]|uniref:hypothetical protein n=1 Tax=Enterococcus cecorum TaxID=44008 RepID=UPI00148CAA26|nr:hypothetical protein [Enterococcus cecorum]MCJ0553950.1 hypothetical protein [Enterococcus cecorum]MCJ0558137.1 hypothetical protein [Enterococcus cecorum]MCJ0561693.1 hypothetical protein [Enterococcus cecorum]MCJ0580909.1 hypothetical protein [Enterococcus cecorum]MDZ5560176.1 hypothetical protein [Enterococcus cecorum]
METLILLIMGTCILGMVIQFLQKEVNGKVFGYAAMFLVIQNSTWLLTFFLADEGVYNDTTIDGLLQMSAGLIMLAICVKYYLQLRKKAKNE